MLDSRYDLASCRAVGAQFVGDHAPWRHALLLQKAGEQTPGGLGVATGLDDLLQPTKAYHKTALVHSLDVGRTFVSRSTQR